MTLHSRTAPRPALLCAGHDRRLRIRFFAKPLLPECDELSVVLVLLRIKDRFAELFTLVNEPIKVSGIVRMKNGTRSIVDDRRSVFTIRVVLGQTDHSIGNVQRFVQLVRHDQNRCRAGPCLRVSRPDFLDRTSTASFAVPFALIRRAPRRARPDSKTFGRMIIAWAMATRCRMPPDISCG